MELAVRVLHRDLRARQAARRGEDEAMKLAVRSLAGRLLGSVGPDLRAMTMPASAQDDPYLWLEDVTGDKPMAWVNEQNATSTAPLLEARARVQGDSTTRFSRSTTRRNASPPSRSAAPGSTTSGRTRRTRAACWRRTTLEEYRKKRTGLGDGARPRQALGRRRTRSGSARARRASTRNTSAAWWRFRAAAPMRWRCASSTSRTKAFVKDGFGCRNPRASSTWTRREYACTSRAISAPAR